MMEMKYNDEWNKFKLRFDKSYADAADEELHYNNFKRAVIFMQTHSSQSYDVGVTQFSDRSPQEIAERYPPMMTTSPLATPIEEAALPLSSRAGRVSIDWSTTNNPLARSVVSAVKNQFQCGACWAFTATEATESSVAMNTGVLEELSVQELIDCDRTWDQGCVGGNPVFAYPYIAAKGLSSEVQYPYIGHGGKCKNDIIKAVSGITGFRVLRSNDEADLALALLQTPVAIGISGTSLSFLMYTGGIYDDPGCGSILNHALLLTGFGTTEKGEDYFVAKNSWGPMWGERGFIRIARNSGSPEGVCGLAKAPTFAVGGFGGNSSSFDPVVFFSALSGRQLLELGILSVCAVSMVVLVLSFAKASLQKLRVARDRRSNSFLVEFTATPTVELTAEFSSVGVYGSTDQGETTTSR